MKQTNIISFHRTGEYLLVLLFTFFTTSTWAQTLRGVVRDETRRPIAGAQFRWMDSLLVATSDTLGQVEINVAGFSNGFWVIQRVGYYPDTLQHPTDPSFQVTLQTRSQLQDVELYAQRNGILLSNASVIKTEQITATELKKSACCDLAGCFETQSTVQPQTTNVVTQSKELRILGLAGVYNQILIDGIPIIQGLSHTYGISSIPGTLVEQIFVSKGSNSVIQGFESISGQINVETKEPEKTPELLVNVYANSFAEKHLNINYGFRGKKWANLTAFHMVQPANRIDRDQDKFLDLPLITRYMLFQKWIYGDEKKWGWHHRVSLRFLQENRVGGQTFFDARRNKGSNSVYGQAINISQPEISIKSGYRFNDEHHISLQVAAYRQRQNSYMGPIGYDAQQSSAYANLQYERNKAYSNWKVGLSFRYLLLNEQININDSLLARTYGGWYSRKDLVPGAFAEHTLRAFNEKLTWLVGLRVDHHQQFGWHVTPRTLVKYDFSPQQTLRLNFGTGWRTVNLFSENIGLLSSSRNVVFTENLQPERAFNWGVNFTQKFAVPTQKIAGHISLDYYHTRFQNQVFPDFDSNPTQAIISNFYGRSVSHGFQAELLLSFAQRWEWKTGYTWLDVYRVINNQKQLLPFNARHKVLNTLSFKPISQNFHVDANLHWYGRQRLPNTQANPTMFQRPDFSRSFQTINLQFTYNLKTVEAYIGCENILDFRQRQPIISWQDPFGPYFDTSSVWGPTRGREWYIGIRYRIQPNVGR